MLILGIDPGSLHTGWALIKAHGNKLSYVASGTLSFNSKTDFLNRLTEIKFQIEELVEEIKADEVAIESLIYVKSPTALIKLAQTRGVIISALIKDYNSKIFEYSPNLIKSTAAGHGHADKYGVQKFLDTLLGKRDYKTHDESDALAVAVCHYFNRGNNQSASKPKSSKGLAGALAHKI